MNGQIPDFWRDISSNIAKKYSLPIVKKAAYFFPWNSNKELFNMVNRRWRILKILGGKPSSFGENTKPEDGYVDRIQIIQYHEGSGHVPPHQDPDHNQRLFMSAYLSKKGVDFQGGGFWALNNSGEQEDLEPIINVGDIAVGSARIIHGVNTITGNRGDIRWFLGLYTNDSDCVNNRKTIEPV